MQKKNISQCIIKLYSNICVFFCVVFIFCGNNEEAVGSGGNKEGEQEIVSPTEEQSSYNKDHLNILYTKIEEDDARKKAGDNVEDIVGFFLSELDANQIVAAHMLIYEDQSSDNNNLFFQYIISNMRDGIHPIKATVSKCCKKYIIFYLENGETIKARLIHFYSKNKDKLTLEVEDDLFKKVIVQSHFVEASYKHDKCGSNCKIFCNLHQNNYTIKKSYKCQICGKKFAKSSNLKSHNNTHGNVRDFICNICGRGFKWKANLKLHKATHTAEDYCKCNICGDLFASNSRLEEHSNVHTVGKPYKCNQCGLEVKWKKSLLHHLKNHSPKIPFKCHTCDKYFSTQGRLNSHMKSHSEDNLYKCDICNRFYKEQRKLQGHYCIHTGENIDKSNSSRKEFSNKSRLKQQVITNNHVRTKNISNIYKCNVCHKSFKKLTSLTNHLWGYILLNPNESQKYSMELIQNFFLAYHKQTRTKADINKIIDPGDKTIETAENMITY